MKSTVDDVNRVILELGRDGKRLSNDLRVVLESNSVNRDLEIVALASQLSETHTTLQKHQAWLQRRQANIRVKRAYYKKLGRKKKEILAKGIIYYTTYDTITVSYKGEELKINIKNVESFKNYYNEKYNEDN